MKELLLLLNKMIDQGVIKQYAIGGATALIHYFEPFQTQDVDVFVVLRTGEESPLVNLSPIYSFLSDHGCVPRNEYVLVSGIPVQFLVPYNTLVDEAVRSARSVDFQGVECRMPQLEHLMAIMVQTGRAKDKARLEELGRFPDLFNRPLFEEIVHRFGLESRWQKIRTEILFP